MKTDVVSYYNGRLYMRRIRRTETWYVTGSKLRTSITFAYRGVTDEWPMIIHYAIR